MPSEADRRRALRIVRRTTGVNEVRDQLRVNPSLLTTAPAIADTELSQRVAMQIARTIDGAKAGEDWWLEGWRVEGRDGDWTMVVTSNQGNVTLGTRTTTAIRTPRIPTMGIRTGAPRTPITATAPTLPTRTGGTPTA